MENEKNNLLSSLKGLGKKPVAGNTSIINQWSDWPRYTGNRHDSVPPKPNIKKEWVSLCNILFAAEKLVIGDTSIQGIRFTDGACRLYSSGQLEQALTQLVDISDAAARTEAEYRKAGVILQGYYAQDKIYDFTTDLLASWGQELAEEDPDMYAKELYNNSLVNIRRLFQRVQDKLQDTGSDCGSPSSKSRLAQRLTALERYHFSDPDLNGFAKAVRETRNLYNQVKVKPNGDEIPELTEDYKKFAESAQNLSALFLDKNKKITEQKLDAFTSAIVEIVQAEKQRIARMKEDIGKAQRLYSQLCDALASEEAVLLMDSLNPKAGQLEGKSAAEIQSLYCPLIEQLRGITAEFKT